MGIWQGTWWGLVRGGTGSTQLLARGEVCLSIEEMDAGHEESLNPSQLVLDDLWRQGSEGQGGNR